MYHNVKNKESLLRALFVYKNIYFELRLLALNFFQDLNFKCF